jgi:hypothetical protein
MPIVWIITAFNWYHKTQVSTTLTGANLHRACRNPSSKVEFAPGSGLRAPKIEPTRLLSTWGRCGATNSKIEGCRRSTRSLAPDFEWLPACWLSERPLAPEHRCSELRAWGLRRSHGWGFGHLTGRLMRGQEDGGASNLGHGSRTFEDVQY